MIPNPESFRIRKLTKVTDVLDRWPLFLQGLEALNKITRCDKQISNDTFLRVLLDTAIMPDDEGGVWVFSSKNDKPLFFCVYFNNTNKYQKGKTLLAYAAYSTEKSKTVVRYSLAFVEDWARERGYTEIQAFSPRFNGAGFYWFEKVLKFRRFLVHFTKAL